MMMCPPKPPCGSLGVTTSSTVSGTLGDLSTILTILGAIGSVAALFAKGAVTILGITAGASSWVGGALGAILAVATVFDFWRVRCLANPSTLKNQCSAGVVQTIIPAFSSASDQIFPFSAQHDRVDVVVKCMYWPLVENFAAFVECNSDPDSSPVLRGYFHNAKVCAAGAGATIGAVVGGVGGIILGVFTAAAIGCTAAAVPIIGWIICLVAMLVAAIIAAVCALIGAFIGGQIGKAAASAPSSPVTDSGHTIGVGDYLTSIGDMLTSGDDDGSRIYWFVTSSNQHGVSMASSPFDHTDPDMNFTNDACPVTAPPTR